MFPDNDPFSSGFSEFSTVSVIMIIFSIIFIIVFVAIIIKGLSTWNKNNHQPKLTVQAKIVSKRTSSHRGAGSHMNDFSDPVYTDYYITFEFESHDRMELMVMGNDFGLLAEGDTGKLDFQGTRFLGFTRDIGQ